MLKTTPSHLLTQLTAVPAKDIHLVIAFIKFAGSSRQIRLQSTFQILYVIDVYCPTGDNNLVLCDTIKMQNNFIKLMLIIKITLSEHKWYV